MTTARKRRLVHVLAVGLLLALIGAFGGHVAWGAAFAAMRDADPLLLTLAVLLNLTSLLLKGVRWWVFLRPLGVESLSLVLRSTFAGASLNNLVVAQGGEGARVLLVARATGVPTARVVGALAAERILDLLSYLTLLVSSAWILDLPPMLTRWRTVGTATLALATLLFVAYGMTHGDRGVSTDPSFRLRRYLSVVRELASPRRLAVAILISFCAWVLQVATYYTVAQGAHLEMPFSGSVAAMLAIGISFLIRATPGNVGVFQVIYAITVRSFGVAEAPAVAVALLIQLVQVLPVVAIGTLVTPRLLAAHAGSVANT